MDERIINKAAEIIYSSEGGYTSVNPDDNGALSVGRLQWHATRALSLCKKIAAALGEAACLHLISEPLYREITTVRSWSSRTLGEEERYYLTALLSTTESVEIQDEQARIDVRSYLEHCASLGVSDEAALIFMADIENQGGGAACARIIAAADGCDIDSLYAAATCDRVFKNYTARRARVYERLTGHPYGEADGDASVRTYVVERGDTLSRIGAVGGFYGDEIRLCSSASDRAVYVEAYCRVRIG